MIDSLKFNTYSVPCTRGHAEHETVVVPIDLSKQHARDFAIFPDNRTARFDFEVYNAPIYETGQWCHGDAGVARGIISQGVWESYETRLAVEIFTKQEYGDVLDFGANMGWYSVLAGLWHHDVIAFEMEPETAAICKRNAERNKVGHYVEVVNGFIDAGSPRLLADRDVLLLKSDVEGSEEHVINCCWDLFETRRIQYAMLEISPCFKPGYNLLLEKLIAQGYGCFVIPNKRSPHRKQFCADPFSVLEHSRVRDPGAFVRGIHQENVIMVRE